MVHSDFVLTENYGNKVLGKVAFYAETIDELEAIKSRLATAYIAPSILVGKTEDGADANNVMLYSLVPVSRLRCRHDHPLLA